MLFYMCRKKQAKGPKDSLQLKAALRKDMIGVKDI